MARCGVIGCIRDTAPGVTVGVTIDGAAVQLPVCFPHYEALMHGGAAGCSSSPHEAGEAALPG